MILGFTGTQRGLSPKQLRSLRKILNHWAGNIQEVHHGDCVGADEEFHGECLVHRIPRIIIHPPDIDTKRAFCHEHSPREPNEVQIVLEIEKPYMERNQDIVDQSTQLIACPKETTEQLRSGTWATHRRARKVGKPVIVIYPDGRVVIQ